MDADRTVVTGRGVEVRLERPDTETRLAVRFGDARTRPASRDLGGEGRAVHPVRGPTDGTVRKELVRWVDHDRAQGIEGTMHELDGALALVTGAAGRIGRATVEVFAEAGARVVASDIDADGLAKSMELVGDHHVVIVADLSTVAEVERLVGGAVDALGGLSVLVNCGAILHPGGTVLDATPESFDRTLAVNVRAPFFAIRAALPHMLEAGRGSIVNISSVLGLVGLAGYSPYAVSKASMLQLTRQVTVEYAAQGIRCNAVCPGTTTRPGELDATEATREYRRELEAQFPVARLGTADEIAQVVRFLASEAGSFMNGSIVVADGGYIAH